MKYIRLFEDIKISEKDNFFDEIKLYNKAYSILKSLVGEKELHNYDFFLDDNYYFLNFKQVKGHGIIKNNYIKCDTFTELKDCVLFHYYFNNGNPSKFLLLLKKFISSNNDLSIFDNIAIKESSRRGWVNMVEFLMKRSEVDPSSGNNYALRNANKKCVISLLKDIRVCDKLDRHDKVKYLKMACRNGYLDIFRNIKSYLDIDPSTNFNYCIRWAYRNGHKQISKLLLDDKRVRDKLSNDEINKIIKSFDNLS